VNPNIADTLSGRAGLAGIQWLLLDTELHEALRQALASLLPSADMLGRCRLYRAKYKPGRYLTAYYEASARGAATGQDIARQVEVTWAPLGSKDRRGASCEMKRRGCYSPAIAPVPST
jgi:hypothetical protein